VDVPGSGSAAGFADHITTLTPSTTDVDARRRPHLTVPAAEGGTTAIMLLHR
jgi:hypothetical protein